MRTLVGGCLFAMAAMSAQAEGFATRDLTRAAPAMRDALGPEFDGRAAPEQLMFACLECPGSPTVSVVLGRQTDGTEGRVRSGATTVADLDRICKSRSVSCEVSALAVAPAVGWVSRYTAGGSAGATAVIIRDGDLLTVRSIAEDAATARRTIDTLLPAVRAEVVGP